MAGIIEVKDQGKVRIYDADNSNYVDIVVPSTVSSNRTITIPDASFTIPQETNATHSGEVTGSGALTIADNVVDEANLKVSNSPTNGYMLTAQSGNTGGLTWAAAGGITEYDMFRLTSDTQGAFTLTSNLERVDTSFEKIGTGMSESSGVFTFPSTGKYEIRFTFTGKNSQSSGERNHVGNIQLTTNNSSYSNVASSSNNIGYYSSSANNWQTTSLFAFLDITDTSNMKVKFNIEANGNSNTYTMSSSASNITYMTFIKIGDT